jgi:hypothetical protein
MANYYYVGTFLPPLSFDRLPEITWSELSDLLQDNLSASDLEQTRIVRRLYDVLNLRSFWLDEEFDAWGNLDSMELEEALFNQEGLPTYVYDFLENYEKKEERLRHFPALLAAFFQRGVEAKGFVHQYLNFEREWRLVFTAFRAKQLGRDLSVELQYENPEEELIAQMLAMKDAKTYEPPEKYEVLKELFDKHFSDPLALQRALDEYRFNTIDRLVEQEDLFSIDRILAYLVQFMIVQKWFTLDQNKGLKIVDTIVKEIS